MIRFILNNNHLYARYCSKKHTYINYSNGSNIRVLLPFYQLMLNIFSIPLLSRF